MDTEKIAKYKERIYPLLKKLKESYSEELDDKIILILKEAEEDGLNIKRDLEDEFKRYYKIVNPYIEKISTRKPPREGKEKRKARLDLLIENLKVEERKEKIRRYKKRLDFLIREFEKGYNKEADSTIASVFKEAEKEGISQEKELKGERERYRLLSQIYRKEIDKAS